MTKITKQQLVRKKINGAEVVGFKTDNTFYVTARSLALAAGYKPNIIFYHFKNLTKICVLGSLQACISFMDLAECSEKFVSRIPYEIIQWIANNSNIADIESVFKKKDTHKLTDVWANEYMYRDGHKIRFFIYQNEIYYVASDLLSCAGYVSTGSSLSYHLRNYRKFNVHSASCLRGKRVVAIRYFEWRTYNTDMQFQLPDAIHDWMFKTSLETSTENEVVPKYPRPEVIVFSEYGESCFRLFPYEDKIWFVASDILKIFGMGSKVTQLNYNAPGAQQFLIRFNKAFQKMYCWTLADVADVSAHINKPFPEDFFVKLRTLEKEMPVTLSQPIETYREEDKLELLHDVLVYHNVPEETIPPLTDDIMEIFRYNRLKKSVS